MGPLSTKFESGPILLACQCNKQKALIAYLEYTMGMGTMNGIGDLKFAFELRDRQIREREESCRKDREELSRDMEAYERVSALMEKFKNVEISSISEPAEKTSKPGSLKRLVAEVLPDVTLFSDLFNVGDVADQIMALPEPRRACYDPNKNRPNISAYLSDFVEDGIIELVEKGSGTRPSTYRLKPVRPTPQEEDIGL